MDICDLFAEPGCVFLLLLCGGFAAGAAILLFGFPALCVRCSMPLIFCFFVVKERALASGEQLLVEIYRSSKPSCALIIIQASKLALCFAKQCKKTANSFTKLGFVLYGFDLPKMVLYFE